MIAIHPYLLSPFQVRPAFVEGSAFLPIAARTDCTFATPPEGEKKDGEEKEEKKEDGEEKAVGGGY